MASRTFRDSWMASRASAIRCSSRRALHNPNERDVLGVAAFGTLEAAVQATGPFDLVDVFRRPALCVHHAREAVAARARCLWLQLGVVNWDAARIAHDGGIGVVMDRCTAIEWRRIARAALPPAKESPFSE